MKRYSVFLCIAGILLGFTLTLRTVATPVQTGPAQQAGTISGQVLLPNGTPFAGVRVGAVSAGAVGGSGPLVTQADREGRYRLTNVPPGAYFLLLDPMDAALYFPGVTDKAGATVVTVAAGATVADRNIQLKTPLAVRVSGRVIREGHQSGTTVVLQGNGIAFSTAIGPDDSFEFTNVRPGTYQARVNPNVNLSPLTVIVDDKDITGLEVVVPLSTILDAMVRINAVVEGGGPTPRAQIAFVGTGNLALPLNTNSPINLPINPPTRTIALTGATQTLQLPMGEYRVTQPAGAPAAAQLPPGYSIKSISAGGVDLLKEPIRITAAGVPAITIAFAVSTPRPWVKVTGKITGMDKAPVKPDMLTLTFPQLAAPLTAPIKADGSFELPAVLPGTYQARLSPLPDTFTRPLTVGVTDMVNIEIPVTLPTVNVSGRVTPAPPPQLQQRTQVALRPDQPQPGGNQMPTAIVAADGSFTLASVRPGTYTLVFSGCSPDVCTPPPQQPVTVTDKDVTNLAITLGPPQLAVGRGGPPRGVNPNVNINAGNVPPNAGINRGGTPMQPASTVTISGKVSADGGVPLPKFRLRFTSGAVTRSLAVNDEIFSAQVPGGAHQVAVADLPDGYVVKSITDGPTDLRSGMLVADGNAAPLAPGTSVPRIAITLGVSTPAPFVKISGKLTGLAGAPPAGAAVSFTGTIFTGPLLAPIKPDGSFETATALPDTYTVRMTHDNGTFSKTLTVGASGLNNLEIESQGSRAKLGEFVKIQPGEFKMGCGQPQCADEAKPVHTVRITKTFEIGKFEVTQAEWQSLMGSNPSSFKGDGRPVEFVSWTEAREFISKLNAHKDGYRYRLPSEAEWEYAARAGGEGGSVEETAWYEANSNLETHPTGQKKPNAWGLFDMRGNIAEWVEDWYAKYSDTPAQDPSGPAIGREHVLRGGSWFSQPGTADVSSRDRLDPAQRSDRIGFRLVREPNP